MAYIDVVVENKTRTLDRFYTYETEEELPVGAVVEVPFGRGTGTREGIVFRTGVTPDPGVKRIRRVTSVKELSLNEEMVRTAEWMRTRYGIRLADAARCFLPPGKPARPGKQKEPYKDDPGVGQDPPVLTDEQDQAVRRIEASLLNRRNDIFLIHGVTSSGKTEVYLHAAEKALALGKTVIMLVPEITLTRQTIERFIGRFGKKEVAVLHSKLTKRQRYDEWVRLRNGEAHIAIGARLGVFAPLDRIGLIIMDEEHESSYKSDQTPKYDTVDIAVKRLIYHGGVLLLGSATPSVVSYARAKEGLYQLIELKHRYNNTPLPRVSIVDMKQEMRSGNRSFFSRRLTQRMQETMAEGKQVILFQNRRGYSTFVACEDCGEALKCPDCGISLVYHKRSGAAECHYCGRRFPLPKACPSCGGRLKKHGFGTEQIEEAAAELFPERTVARLDLDTAKTPRAIEGILRAFSKGKTDILIGTQLVAKGLDFANVGLVGIVSADASLNIPDFRSSERTFQLITQAAGRAGRGDEQGEVIVQSLEPDNFILKAAQAHDYKAFFEKEAAMRQFMDYPPFSDMIVAEFTADDPQKAEDCAEACREELMAAGLPGADRIFAPKMAYAGPEATSFRCRILMKCPRGERNKYVYCLRRFGDRRYAAGDETRMVIDVNPYGFL